MDQEQAAAAASTNSTMPSSPRARNHSHHHHHTLPPETSEYLRKWMMSPEHIHHPYPSEEEKIQMMQETGIELKQLNNWFVNNRKRYWKPRVMDMVASGSLQQLQPQQEEEDFHITVEAPPEHSTTTTVTLPDPNMFDNLGGLRDADVLATKLAFSRNHAGNVFYRQLVDKYCGLMSAATQNSNSNNQDQARFAEKIFTVITVDRQGRFLKETSKQHWTVMPKDAVLRKIVLALKNGQYKLLGCPKTTTDTLMFGTITNFKKAAKKKRKRKTTTKQKKIHYQAQQGSDENCVTIHPYTLEILTQVCNVDEEDQALKVLDEPIVLPNSEVETEQERLQRLQLRHRYYAAWDGGMSPKEFSKKLLEFWGGSLVETVVEEEEETSHEEDQQDHQALFQEATNQESLLAAAVGGELENNVSPFTEEDVTSFQNGSWSMTMPDESSMSFSVPDPLAASFSVPNPLAYKEDEPAVVSVESPFYPTPPNEQDNDEDGGRITATEAV